MKLRAFATAWTLFTALAAPTLLLAQEPPPVSAPVPPANVGDPVEEALQPAPEPAPAPTPAPAEPSQPALQADPAPAPAPAPVPAADEEPAPKPVARKAASASVTISDFKFTPSSVTVNVGDTVTWTNDGPTVHTATGDDFDTGNLSKGESGSHTFEAAGTFSYICTPHPYMKGKVTVTAASDNGGNSDGDSLDDSPDNSGTAGESDDSDTSSGSETADDGSDSLPDTGADAWALALLGTGLLSLGVAVRRRAVED